MNIPAILGSPRGTRDLLRRVIVILSRFGITPGKMEVMLNRYLNVTEEYSCEPTFPITAVTLKRHPELIKRLDRRGVEFAIHGYIHIDYQSLSLEEQIRHFEKAVAIFKSCEIPFIGFRGPYLRSNNNTIEALGRLKFCYDSSRVMRWNVIDPAGYSKMRWKQYSKLLEFYEARDADNYLSMPRFENGLMEIPVSIPDDEAMVGRLGIKEKQEIARIWQMIFQRTYARGELFTVQLHHERVPFCESALRSVLEEARGLDPKVWIATLGEIAEWWTSRRGFTFEVHPEVDKRWRIRANCAEKATVLAKYCKASCPAEEWAGNYQSIESRDFIVESHLRPCIGVAPNSSPKAINFIESEGFIVEISEQPEDYGIYFDDLADFGESDERPISEAIEHSTAPLVRYWRWPNGAKSALAVTGDIDSMTLIDFVLRVFEVWRQRMNFRGI